MFSHKYFLDTSYVIALLNSKDHYHEEARSMQHSVQGAKEVWTTEAVLVEIGDSLSGTHRAAAASFINFCYNTSNIRVINVTTDMMKDAVGLYLSRQDKTWGLTDCISFIVMGNNSLSHALTSDKHFEQAGFIPLLRNLKSS